MRDPELSRASGRVEGIAEQEECPRHGGILGGEEARLTAAVGVAPEIDALRAEPADRLDGGPEPRTVPSRARPATAGRAGAPAGTAGRSGAPRSRGRRARSARATRSGLSEDAPGAVGEDETLLGGARGCVERPAHCRLVAGLPVERDGRRTSGIRRAHGRMPGPRPRCRAGAARRAEVAVVVFFDVAGTLIRVRDGVGAQYARVAARFGVTADPAVLEREFPRAFRSAPRMAFPGASPEAIPRLEREVWLGIVMEVFAGAGLLPAFAPGAFDAYFDAVYRHFEDAGVWEVFPDVMPVALGAARARVPPRRRQQLRRSRRAHPRGAEPGAVVRLDHAVEPGRRDEAGPDDLPPGPRAPRGRAARRLPRRRLACRGL